MKIFEATLAVALLALPVAANAGIIAPQDPQAQQRPAQQSQSYKGQIVKGSAGYAVQTATGTYTLDNQDLGKQFEGKTVVVTGTLDTQSGVIHVADIQPAS